MNWYKGSIAEAVAHSKLKNAIFVVYVEGKDENSIKLSKFIDEAQVKDKLENDDFVAIKIASDSQAYMQFASIYQMVPVPSIFFIGSSGTPLEIATGVVASADELKQKIAKVLDLSGKKPATSSDTTLSQTFIDNESQLASGAAPKQPESQETKSETQSKKSDESTEVVCEGGVCYKKPKESASDTPDHFVEQEKQSDAGKTPAPCSEEEIQSAAESTETRSDTEPKEEEKLADTRKYLEQKRRERIEEEKRLEREWELRRRKEGKEMQNQRESQKEQELKELKQSIKRERLEEQAARERILAQIEADKAERAQKFATDSQPSTSQGTPASQNPAPQIAAPDETRLQFRFASGNSKTNKFKCSSTLEEVRDYVKNELLVGTGIKEFTLATTYPKREFGREHYTKTLVELELFPSAVILIIGSEATGPSAMIARHGGVFNIFHMVIMSILNPIFGIFTAAKKFITGQRGGRGQADDKGVNNAQTGAQKRANEERGVQDDVAKRRNLDRFLNGNTPPENEGSSSGGSSQAYRRYVTGSNVHRLSDNRKDSDDENATWNGNSTQQQ